MLPYFEDYDVERIHVQEPFDVVLLCGGNYSDISDPTLYSLRDAFLKAYPQPKSLKNKEIILAETITQRYGFFQAYDDLLDFETDLAQIVELIIMFCESEGSLAELGAFAVIQEIMKRLFVVVREHHWDAPSFIKLGPLKKIQREVGREAICVISNDDLGITDTSVEHADKSKLIEMLERSLEGRLARTREATTFDKTRAGHIIKLITGLVQEYGALTFGEIAWLVKKVGAEVTDSQLRGYLHCGIAVDWLFEVSKGATDYYVQTATSLAKGKDAATLIMKEGSKQSNKMRRRLAIRDHWKNNDKNRFAAIQKSGWEAELV